MAKTAALTIALMLAVLSAGSISPAAVTVAAEGDAWVTSRFATHNFGSETVTVGYTILRNYCDPWPYEDPLRGNPPPFVQC